MATYKYTKLNRRGYEVVLPTSIYNEIKGKGYNISLVLNSNKQASTVQITKDNRYYGTLKAAMGVSSFKNGNPCDFHKSNLICED